jgi:DNA-directed RNA polymerase subunit M/transcription elongation factor TFIIS
MKFCSCGFYFYLSGVNENVCRRICRNCGNTEDEKSGILVSETIVKERTSEAYKLVNEFTRQDPTLPHLKSMKCPQSECDSNVGKADKDVIYIKYDPANLKFLYICNVCGEQWRSRS